MKKYFLFLFVFIPVMANAQKFYSSSDVEVSWKYWDSEISWNYLVNNGKKLSLSCLPPIQSSGITMTNPIEICATYLLKKKFIVITFSESEGIKLRTSGPAVSFSSLFGGMSYVSQQTWYNIDFENIVYDPIFNRIMIPCGVDNNGYFNAICVKFLDSNTSVESIKSDNDEQDFDESKVKYYDLLGREVNPIENSKGRILIKSDGKKTVKFLSK